MNENGRHYGATARIRGVLDYVTLVGPNAVAGVISPEHAENVRRKCMSLLTTSEDMQDTLKFSVISCSAMDGWRCVWDDRGGGKR